MQQSQPLHDQMEAYLLGTLPTDQEQQFLARVDQDPLMKEELELQRDIMEGLKSRRAAQLKAHLQQLPAPPAAIPAALGWGLGAAAVALIGAGAYFIWPANLTKDHAASTSASTTAPASEPVTIEEPASDYNTLTEARGKQAVAQEPLPTTEAKPTVTNLLSETIVSKPNRATTKASPILIGKRANTFEQVAASKNRVTADENSRATTKTNVLVLGDNPDVEADNANSLSKRDLNVPTGKIVNETEETSKPEIVISEQEKLAYQYYDHKLYLYGPFGGELYELLELNARDGKRLYIFYLNQFYRVRSKTRDITPMQPIENKDEIEQLEQLRLRRVD